MSEIRLSRLDLSIQCFRSVSPLYQPVDREANSQVKKVLVAQHFNEYHILCILLVEAFVGLFEGETVMRVGLAVSPTRILRQIGNVQWSTFIFIHTQKSSCHH
jgi:hypothetical protein